MYIIFTNIKHFNAICVFHYVKQCIKTFLLKSKQLFKLQCTKKAAVKLPSKKLFKLLFFNSFHCFCSSVFIIQFQDIQTGFQLRQVNLPARVGDGLHQSSGHIDN